MKTYTKEELAIILEKHANWFYGRDNAERAYLQDADLRGAYLQDANLQGAKNIPKITMANTLIVPQLGAFEGWKKLCNGFVAHIRCEESARRSNSTGRKCRCESALVLAIYNGEKKVDVGYSQFRPTFEYKVGEVVKCDAWEENRWVECGGGIHFFLTREEAEEWEY